MCSELLLLLLKSFELLDLFLFFFRSAHNSRRLFEHGVTVEVRRPDRLRSAPTSNGRGAAHLATRRPDRPVRRRNNGRAIVSFFFLCAFRFPTRSPEHQSDAAVPNADR